MKNIYSLASHIITLDLSSTGLSSIVGTDTISIGGSGSYLDKISISITNNLLSISGDYTGSYVVNKNLNATGSIDITINQMSDQLAKLRTICNLFKSNDYDGMTITVKTLDGQLIATAYSCYISKIPNVEFGSSASTQSWSFISGKVVIE